ncbi:hypothetical protein F5B22DRAFT_529627 [Xylaria bambusicola]|uniref:uncharacterized protein n=1 Tax=Xylaria bambusicola TaxID=326684 RepID=UPI0020081AB8|nr:uncharacterized protein F5B22DRAFT_529627 [Xylaria bambusicola]KAI0505238.1 hypothetical protein F5B22DRAFT_529627 [Xylaria bambusicola]
MESIKKFFSSCTKSIEKSKSKGRPQISQPVEGSFKRLTPDIGLATECDNPTQISSSPRRDSSHHPNGSPTIPFTPKGRGREETIEWLTTGTCDSLTSLLNERDKASRQVKLGPNTKGMKEVQQILKEPSCHTMKQLHNLKQETEVTLRYGAPGAMMFNFSKTLGWNQASQPLSLQLRSFGTTKEEPKLVSASIPPLPFSPISWFVLPQQPAPVQIPSMHEDRGEQQQPRPPSPISEPGGWRDDTDQIDIADMRLDPFLGMAVSATNGAITDDDDDEDEDEDEDLEGEFSRHGNDVVSTEAVAVKITPVSTGQVHQVRIRKIK